MNACSYRFGPFVVDRAAYRVLRGNETLDLTPKLLDLLLHLLDNAGALVTKEQLLDALWPGANVTENALAQAVSELRQALGDPAGSPRFIKTIARRGYRFVGSVEVLDRPRTTAAERPPDPLTERAGQPIAVLDFTNMTGDAESAWLSAGIAETVANDLRALGHFRVVDRWHVMEAARRTNGSLQQIAADLGATLSVVGSYQRLGGRIRITARVVDVATGEAIADAKVDGPFDRIFELQDEVVARFSRDLGVPTAQPRTSGRNSRDTASLEAYRAFIEGSLRLETLDIREIPAAIADFERAVGLDRRYAPGYAGLASAEFALYETTRADVQPADDLLQRAIGHARDALRLDDTLAEAHATLALLLTSGWQPDEAVAAARRAIAIDPDNWRHLFRLGHASWGHQRLRAAANMLAQYPDFAFAHFQVAMVHVARGHLAEAESVLRQGAAVQDRQIVRGERYPALGLHWLLGLVRLAQDDVEEARTELDRERELAQPHRLYGREYAMNALHGIGATLLRGGNPSSAIDHFARALALYPDDARSHLGIALAHRAEGSQREADAALRRVEDALARLVTRPAEAGIVRAELRLARDDADGAIRTLGQMLAEAPRGFAGWTLPVEPFLRQLHADERFAAVLTRLADRAR